MKLRALNVQRWAGHIARSQDGLLRKALRTLLGIVRFFQHPAALREAFKVEKPNGDLVWRNCGRQPCSKRRALDGARTRQGALEAFGSRFPGCPIRTLQPFGGARCSELNSKRGSLFIYF